MNILIVGPHPDDQELGMGGTIARLAAQGHSVLLLDITDGEPTPHGSPEIRAGEAAEAASALSAPGNPVRRLQLGLHNRFVEHTIENRHKVAGVIRAHQAQVVFVPYPRDAHPDHRAVTRIVEDARFDAKLTKLDMPAPEGFGGEQRPIYPKWLFYYFATHLRIVPQPGFIMDIAAQLEAKLASITAYRSQFDANPKNRAVIDWVRAQAVYFGSRIDTAAAEPFWTPEPLGLSGFADLVMQGRGEAPASF
jgi:N-acetylglucosamine malate deacetylase 1